MTIYMYFNLIGKGNSHSKFNDIQSNRQLQGQTLKNTESTVHTSYTCISVYTEKQIKYNVISAF